jgi:hypothetical protein
VLSDKQTRIAAKIAFNEQVLIDINVPPLIINDNKYCRKCKKHGFFLKALFFKLLFGFS